MMLAKGVQDTVGDYHAMSCGWQSKPPRADIRRPASSRGMTPSVFGIVRNKHRATFFTARGRGHLAEAYANLGGGRLYGGAQPVPDRLHRSSIFNRPHSFRPTDSRDKGRQSIAEVAENSA